MPQFAEKKLSPHGIRSLTFLKRWQPMAEIFKSGARPDDLGKAYEMLRGRAGLYQCESQAIWDFIRAKDIRSIVEVGRNAGAGVFLLACAARNLCRFLSIDVFSCAEMDEVIPAWANINGFEMEVVTCDSMEYEPDRNQRWDFVFVDGGHTGSVVTNDLEKFRGLTRYIGFHDFADLGRRNTHKICYRGVVEAVSSARDRHGWKQVGSRGRSEVIFDTGE